MTEAEQLELFERKVRRYLNELRKLNLSEDTSEFGPATNEYFDAATNLGAALLLQMVEAYQERPQLLDSIKTLRDQFEAKSHEATAEAVLLERAEAELGGLREEVRAMAAQIEAAIVRKGGAA